MIKLEKAFIMNGLHYQLIKRSDLLALFSVQGGIRYEVARIYILPKQYVFNYRYPEREGITDNSRYGLDGSRDFRNITKALKYFEELNEELGGFLEYEDFGFLKDHAGIDITIGEKIASGSDSSHTSSSENEPAKQLPRVFKRKNVIHRLIKRDDKVGLYELVYNRILIGYEVCSIKITPRQIKFNKNYPMRESLPSDNEFGLEGSKSFFPYEYDAAVKYFGNLSRLLHSENSDNIDKDDQK